MISEQLPRFTKFLPPNKHYCIQIQVNDKHQVTKQIRNIEHPQKGKHECKIPKDLFEEQGKNMHGTPSEK